jgi:hypothetical protein
MTTTWNGGKATQYKLRTRSVKPVMAFGQQMLFVEFVDGSYLFCEKVDLK